jgi:ABC-type oligopeptide transport system substrate-binding subunit
MNRRSIAVVVATFAMSALAACAEPSTAPQPSQLAPRGVSSRDALDPSLCRGGWSNSEGRCL